MTASPEALAALRYAEAQVGKPYVWGKTGPDAFDCSGLMYAAYRSVGVKIPRTTATMLAPTSGLIKVTSRADLVPGDIIFPYPGHCFMFAGGDQIVEAPHTGTRVHITTLYKFWTARRPLPPVGPAGSMTGHVPTGETTVRSGSYNVHSTTTGAQTKADLSKLTSMADVLSLSEWQGAKRTQGIQAYLQSRGWAFYLAPDDTAVTWNAAKYDAVTQKTVPLNPSHFGKSGLKPRYAATVLLQDKQTGAQFWQVSVHTVPKGDAQHTTGTPAQRAAVMTEQQQSLTSLYRSLVATGVPVFLSGDMALGVSNIPGAIPDTGKRRVFESLSQTRALASRVIKGLNSDHNALIATYRVSGSTGGSGGGNAGNTAGFTADTAAFQNAGLIGGSVSAADSFFKFITGGDVWVRVALFIGGLVLLILALVVLTKGSSWKPAR